jgi:putative polyhydroxyalkanoate system protein
MAKIEMSKNHTIGKDAAKAKAAEIADSMKAKIGIEWAWNGDKIVFEAKSGTAKGAKGHIDVSDSKLFVLVELPFLLSAFKGMVEGKIKEKLDAIP